MKKIYIGIALVFVFGFYVIYKHLQGPQVIAPKNQAISSHVGTYKDGGILVM